MQEIPQSHLAQALTQQQCHLPILEIQRSTITNRVLNATKHAKWVDQRLEDAMEIVERGHISFVKGNHVLEHSTYFTLNHVNCRTNSRKVGPQGVLIEHEDVAIVTCILNM
jgi:hypothetical protein